MDNLDNTNIASEFKHQKFKLYGNKELKFLEFKNTIYDILAKLKLVKKRNFEQDLKIPKIQDNFTLKNIKKTLDLFLNATVFKKKQKKIKIRKVTDNLFEFDNI